MFELARAIPDAEVLLALEPEELASRLLFLLRNRSFARGIFHPGNLCAELFDPGTPPVRHTGYPQSRQDAVERAVLEAFAWLEAQGLIVTAPGTNGTNGWRFLSRRAQKFASEAELTQYAVVRTIPKSSLHPRIAEKVWMALMRGEFDVAVFQAMKNVEVSVREAAGLGAEMIGVHLVRRAFNPDKGKLTDTTSERAERVARMELFAGAIGSYKNPHSHRDVDINDAAEAIEIILLANHLLRILDARRRAVSAIQNEH